MHVAVLCEYPTLNGGERSLLACVDRLRRDRVAFTFLAPADGPLAAELAARHVRQLPFDVHPRGQALSRVDVLKGLVGLCATGFDLLHANSVSMGRLAGAAAGALPIPCTAHLRDIVRLSPAAVADLNRNARLIAVSSAVHKFHVAQGVCRDRMCVVYNGIDGEMFRPAPRTGWLRRELSLPPDAFIVAAIGQVCLRKAQDIFAEGAIRASMAIPEAHFVLVGARHSSKPESLAFEAALRRRFLDAGLADRFHPLGERPDVGSILNELDVLVHAARQEPFGRVLLEAAAAGVAIIATDVGGTGEMLRDGEHACLLPPGDPAAIAAALVRLAHDPLLRSRLGDQARRHVVQRFPIERAARELLDVWRGALQRGSVAAGE